MRHPDWQARFWAELERQRTRQFAYGICDCILFGAEVADAISDGGYVKRARTAFSWTDADEASALLSERSLMDLIESVLGPATPWTRLSTGDLVLCSSPIDESGVAQMLCVHDGTSPIAKVDCKLLTLTWDRAVCGWRVE